MKLWDRTRGMRVFLTRPIKLPGFVLVLLGIFEFFPDWQGRIDYWVHLYVTNHIFADNLTAFLRSPFTGVGMVLAGLVYLYYARGVVHVHHGELTASTAPQASMMAVLIPGPDMPIRELFLMLAPSGFKSDAERNEVGREIIDKFASGFLKVWGRRIVGSQRLALAEIPKEEWLRATFGPYWLLDPGEGNRQVLHAVCETPSGKREYADLQVRREMAETFWPNDQVALNSAARILYEAVEEAGITSSVVGVPYSSPDVALDHFKYVLLSQDVALTGVRAPSSKARAVPADMRASLRPISGNSDLAFLQASQGAGYTHVTIGRRDLMRVCREHVETLKRLEVASL